MIPTEKVHTLLKTSQSWSPDTPVSAGLRFSVESSEAVVVGMTCYSKWNPGELGYFMLPLMTLEWDQMVAKLSVLPETKHSSHREVEEKTKGKTALFVS